MRAFSACNSHGSIHLDAKVHPENPLKRSSHSHRGEIQQPVRERLHNPTNRARSDAMIRPST